MSDRGRRRISDGGLIFITMMVTILLCVLWVAASADATESSRGPREAEGQPDLHGAPGILAGAHASEKRN